MPDANSNCRASEIGKYWKDEMYGLSLGTDNFGRPMNRWQVHDKVQTCSML